MHQTDRQRSLRAEALGRYEEGAGMALADLAHHEGRDDSRDRKSTRLNSSHQIISYAVFCLKKKISVSISNPAKYQARRRTLERFKSDECCIAATNAFH